MLRQAADSQRGTTGHPFVFPGVGAMRISGKPIGGTEPLSKYSGRGSPWRLSQFRVSSKCRFHLGSSLVRLCCAASVGLDR